MRPYSVWCEVGLAVVVILFWNWGWLNTPLNSEQLKHLRQVSERELAAIAIQNQAVASMTVVSILFVAIGALLPQLKDINQDARQHLRMAAPFCLTSLFLGLWIIGSLPVEVNFYNVAYSRGFALFSQMQLVTTFFAGARTMFAVWQLLA